MSEKEFPKLPKMVKWSKNDRDAEASSSKMRPDDEYNRELQAYWAGAWFAAGTAAVVTFMLIFFAVLVTGEIGAEASVVEVQNSAVLYTAPVVARAYRIDNTSVISGTGCAIALGSTSYPTPSAVFVTQTADATGTDPSSTTATSESASTCDAAETVTMTVTVTTSASYDAVSATTSTPSESESTEDISTTENGDDITASITGVFSTTSDVSTTESSTTDMTTEDVDGVTASTTGSSSSIATEIFTTENVDGVTANGPSTISITATTTLTLTLPSTALTTITIPYNLTSPNSTHPIPLLTNTAGTAHSLTMTNGSFTFPHPTLSRSTLTSGTSSSTPLFATIVTSSASKTAADIDAYCGFVAALAIGAVVGAFMLG